MNANHHKRVHHNYDFLIMQDSQGNNPLHYAAGYGRAEFVKDLIDAGAKGFKKNKSGHTPFDLVK